MKVGEIGNFIKNQSVRKDKVFDFISFQTTQHQKRIRKEYNRIDSYVFCQHNAR